MNLQEELRLVVFCLALLSQKSAVSEGATNVTISFNRDNLAVRFSPFVSPADQGNPYVYGERDLLPMIRLIATKFSKFIIQSIADFDEERSEALTITGAALFNRENKPAVPLEVFVAYSVGDKNFRPGGSPNLTFVDLALKYSEKANSIHPGTVRSIIIDRSGPSRVNPDEMKGQVLEAHRAIETISGRNNYRLGVMFLYRICSRWEQRGNGFLSHLLGYLDLVIFDVSLFDEVFSKYEFNELVTNLTQSLHECKQKIQKIRPGIEVAFQTGLSDTGYDGNQNFSKFVTFWREMNDWAARSKTTVIMFEAFNQPYRKTPFDTLWWWRLKNVNDTNFNTTSDQYEFEDKTEAAWRQEKEAIHLPRMQVGSSRAENNSSSEMMGIVVVSAVAVLLIVGGTGAGMFFLYKKVSRVEQSVLNKEEIREFFEGNMNSGGLPNADIGGGDGILRSLNLTAYDRKSYELARRSFTIDEASPLGMGMFGLVCRGTVSRSSQSEEVAVKMLKQPSTTTALKGLLSEIKVMSYLGRHANLVQLVGAYTAEVLKGKVYVFTELCGLGSLEKYLREYEPIQLQESYEDGGYSSLEATASRFISKDGVGQLDSNNLLQWSYQIASGMAFIALKQVVHADLATRNVLLTSDRTAKISDFGLSRRLYDYTEYVKTEQEPLPWRWMAPESLRKSHFNEKTDVWAFGVTLWEIYSLGDVPYPGLVWTLDFPTELTDGLRLQEPEHNADDMYSAMLNCWSIDPVERPTFRELEESFKK